MPSGLRGGQIFQKWLLLKVSGYHNFQVASNFKMASK